VRQQSRIRLGGAEYDAAVAALERAVDPGRGDLVSRSLSGAI
jgi:hypothetical protein